MKCQREAASVLRVLRGDPRLTPPKWGGLVLAIPLMSGTPGLVIAAAVAALILGWFLMVVCPAIWSNNDARRKAALAVLEVFRKR
jgi:hypothetical protein